MRDNLTKPGLWIVKVGSAVLTNNGKGLSHELINNIAEQIVKLKRQGFRFVIVSSGSIAEGLTRLKLHERPHEIYRQQAAAAVGQMGLIQAYESAFSKYGIHTAQILLTHDDIADRKRYLNARSSITELIKLGVIPIVNENDTVAVDEIRFGDNDSLGALVVNLLEADALVILTDQEGMYDKDPRIFNDAKLLSMVTADSKSLDKAAGKSSGDLGRGGMYTKLQAARSSSGSGAMTVIASGVRQDVLLKIAKGENAGTFFPAQVNLLTARGRWLAGQIRSKGELVLDTGAVKFITEQGKSLLPVGVSRINGEYSRGDLVKCVNAQGTEIARGLSNYNSYESRKIIGKPSSDIESILGYIDEPELIHRDNMILTRKNYENN